MCIPRGSSRGAGNLLYCFSSKSVHVVRQKGKGTFIQEFPLTEGASIFFGCMRNAVSNKSIPPSTQLVTTGVTAAPKTAHLAILETRKPLETLSI
jgi:hypothetical protein